MMMFPQLASTAASFTRASSLVLKVGTDAHLYDDPHDADIVRLLDSRFDAEKIEAMKRLIALMSQGCDVSSFFPQVVKSVASTSLEVKKLVYIYLVHYAEKRPDEALLSINTFQKDLIDFNPLVRAWALRAMSGIQVLVVAPLMLMAIQRCAKDASPYVRRCAANAIPKLHALDTEQYHDVLVELVGALLDDMSAGVIGAAVSAFTAICPEQLTLVTHRFQSLCESLPDVEEWGQVLLVDILLRYVVARHGIPKRQANSQDLQEQNSKRESFLWSSDMSQRQNSEENKYSAHMDDDVKLLLQSTSPLLRSHNSAVVMGAAGVYWLLAPEEERKRIVKPLLFLMRSSFDSQCVVIANLATFAQSSPYLFKDFYEDFFIRSSDIDHIRAVKLEILPMIATEVSISAIMQELQAYVRDCDRQLAARAVTAIGKCAKIYPSIALSCMKSLLFLVKGGNACGKERDSANSKTEKEKQSFGSSQTCGNMDEDREAAVTVQAVLAIKLIMQQHFQELEKVFGRLVRDLNLIGVPAARAVIIWMIGEYGSSSTLIKEMLPSLLKYFAGCFVKEEAESKLQIVNSVCKIILGCREVADFPKEEAWLALTYILDLASCDVNYDVRDRGRMFKKLMALQLNIPNFPPERASSLPLPCESSLPECILVSRKATSIQQTPSQENCFLPGSISHIVRHRAPGYQPLPEPFSLKGSSRSLEGIEILENYPDDLLKRNREVDGFHQISEYSESYTSGCSDTCSNDRDSVPEAGNGMACLTASESESSSASPKASNAEVGPLISLSDAEVDVGIQSGAKIGQSVSPQSSTGASALRSREELESWLSTCSEKGPEESTRELSMPCGFVTLTLDSLNTEPKAMILLDFTNGEGLEVRYSYLFSDLEGSQGMVSVRLFFSNKTSEAMSCVSVKDGEAPPGTKLDGLSLRSTALERKEKVLVVQSEEIPTLSPHQVLEGNMYINFYQQLSPVKLAVCCNQKCFSVKLTPDIGAFLRPKVMTHHEFASAESGLPGMFETTRRCTLKQSLNNQKSPVLEDDQEILSLARLVASRVLQNVNVFLISATLPVFTEAVGGDSWHVYLKFSGETLMGSMLCLITIMLQADEMKDIDSYPVLMKMNCEDSVFALNLLKRLEKAINEIC